MIRFFSEGVDLESGEIEIFGDDYNHIKNVLRMKAGDRFEVISDGSVYEVRLEGFAAKSVKVRILSVTATVNESPIKIILYQGLIKGDKMDTVIQKAVELGVDEIHPVLMHRSVMRLEADKASKRIEKWQKIAKEAAKQSKRDIIPTVGKLKTLAEIQCSGDMLIPYECASEGSLKKELNSISLSSMKRPEISVVIGPEGGFDPSEIELLKGKGARIVTLGRRILRTETAGMAVLSMIQYELGDMG